MQSLIRSKSAGVTGGRGTAGAGPGRDLLYMHVVELSPYAGSRFFTSAIGVWGVFTLALILWLRGYLLWPKHLCLLIMWATTWCGCWMLCIVHGKNFMQRMFVRRFRWRTVVGRLLTVRLSL